MYDLTITNNFAMAVEVTSPDAVTIAAHGGAFSKDNLGNLVVDIPGMGPLLFLDLGDKKLDGYNLTEIWGGLIRYQAIEIYFRYEGQGSVSVVIDEYGCVALTDHNGSSELISLPNLSCATC